MNWRSISEPPPAQTYNWIQTESGIVAIGAWDGGFWRVDGWKVLSAYDQVLYWAALDYPEGPPNAE